MNIPISLSVGKVREMAVPGYQMGRGSALPMEAVVVREGDYVRFTLPSEHRFSISCKALREVIDGGSDGAPSN